MVWEFLNRWKRVLRLVAVARGDRVAATARVRDAFDQAGAWLTDVHFFSGVQTTFSFEMDARAGSALGEALRAAGLELDDASEGALRACASGEGELQGTLAVTFAQGDTDLTHEVPAVPG